MAGLPAPTLLFLVAGPLLCAVAFLAWRSYDITTEPPVHGGCLGFRSSCHYCCCNIPCFSVASVGPRCEPGRAVPTSRCPGFKSGPTVVMAFFIAWIADSWVIQLQRFYSGLILGQFNDCLQHVFSWVIGRFWMKNWKAFVMTCHLQLLLEDVMKTACKTAGIIGLLV